MPSIGIEGGSACATEFFPWAPAGPCASPAGALADGAFPSAPASPAAPPAGSRLQPIGAARPATATRATHDRNIAAARHAKPRLPLQPRGAGTYTDGQRLYGVPGHRTLPRARPPSKI